MLIRLKVAYQSQRSSKVKFDRKCKIGIICDPMPANEALCGKINFELWAKM